MELDAKKVEKISKALGDSYRLQIMAMAKSQDDACLKCACIIDNIGLAQSTISHHLSQLVDADLLIATKDGRNVNYRVNKETMDSYLKFLSAFKS
ncbi:ArsR/SmtB family transcription factor [Mucilaginibacter auburnensis]|uniref:DNA-binding transcriptional ArsR family regulator n=1 Tax=Mucilaginibacter auburnensis TaxID=1457233 RepID=A0A2H9VPA8_9SPHI|nr:metalloregulator ArsR/SmtB family transcription factor [Mucilaginibacter auburnensis]PJJ80156.1 DNA-binding transcriptional ArsR family regulator [Mucilaginibacter auburnensis]